MNSTFCCPFVTPYRPKRLDHENKFERFMQWTKSEPSPTQYRRLLDADTVPYAIQLVKQANFGPQESIRYFAPAGIGSHFVELTEGDLLEWNFEKLNSYKNFKCEKHDKFFEVNLYQRNPTNSHHWRANLARPSRDIDLAFRAKEHQIIEPEVGNKDSERLIDQRQGEISIQNLNNSKSVSLEVPNIFARREKDDKSLEVTPLIAEENISTLKSVLRFLLPPRRISLRSNCLLSLLSLDWLNENLSLELNLEPAWVSGLTSSNIIIFLMSCFRNPADDGVNIEEVEALVITAMEESRRTWGQEFPGRKRLQEIVTRVLDSENGVDWVLKYGDDVRSVLDSFPNANFLEESLRASEKYKSDWSDQDSEVTQNLPQDESEEETSLWEVTSYYHPPCQLYEYDYDSEPVKDFTACDQECGYCGHCDY